MMKRSQSDSITEHGGDLTGLGWLNTVTLSLAALEVDPASASSGQHNSSVRFRRRSISGGCSALSRSPPTGRSRSKSFSSVASVESGYTSSCSDPEALSDTDDISDLFRSDATRSDAWKSAKRSVATPMLSLECLVALAVSQMKGSSHSVEKIVDYLRAHIPYYAAKPHKELLDDVGAVLKFNRHFHTSRSNRSHWIFTANVPLVRGAPSKGIPKRRLSGKKKDTATTSSSTAQPRRRRTNSASKSKKGGGPTVAAAAAAAAAAAHAANTNNAPMVPLASDLRASLPLATGPLAFDANGMLLPAAEPLASTLDLGKTDNEALLAEFSRRASLTDGDPWGAGTDLDLDYTLPSTFCSMDLANDGSDPLAPTVEDESWLPTTYIPAPMSTDELLAAF